MTKSQIWVLSFLIIFFALFLLVRMTRQEEEVRQMPHETTPQTDMSTGEVTAPELITRFGCRGCHGAELEGSRMGPALADLGQHWNRDELINYLRNPNSYMDKDRFRKYQEQYPGILMPSFSNVDIKDLGRMADYLLTK
jgi:mono/diheme cytochrome c family protein